jgi:hypothetical protein
MIAFVQIGVRGGELGDRLVEPVALAKGGRDRLPMRFIAWRRAGCVERSGDELAIAGDITIKGHTGPVELKATITEPIADPYGGMRILGISGSLRRDSYNTALLRHAGRVVRLRVRSSSSIPASAKSPVRRGRRGQRPTGRRRLRAAIAGADGVFFVTPEYNSSIPGVLENALDWVSRPIATNTIRNKPVAVMGASTSGFGANERKPNFARCSAPWAHASSTGR